MTIPLRKLLMKLREPVQLVVGFPKEKQVVYPPDNRKGHDDEGGQSVGYIANIQEYGTKDKHIPSRPFLRTAMIVNKEKIRKMAYGYFQTTDERYLDKMGVTLVNMVRDSIRNGHWVPNAESTKISKLKYETQKLLGRTDEKSVRRVLAEKAKIKPLIDRGIMLNNVSYFIRKG